MPQENMLFRNHKLSEEEILKITTCPYFEKAKKESGLKGSWHNNIKCEECALWVEYEHLNGRNIIVSGMCHMK